QNHQYQTLRYSHHFQPLLQRNHCRRHHSRLKEVQQGKQALTLTTNVFYSFHISLFENSVFSEQKNLYLPICYCNRKPSDSSSSDSRTNRLKPVIFAAPVKIGRASCRERG